MVIERIMAALKRMFGAAADGAEIIDSALTRWERDPFARGSYSFCRPSPRNGLEPNGGNGGGGDYASCYPEFAILGEPEAEGCLRFAGE